MCLTLTATRACPLKENTDIISVDVLQWREKQYMGHGQEINGGSVKNEYDLCLSPLD